MGLHYCIVFEWSISKLRDSRQEITIIPSSTASLKLRQPSLVENVLKRGVIGEAQQHLLKDLLNLRYFDT